LSVTGAIRQVKHHRFCLFETYYMYINLIWKL